MFACAARMPAASRVWRQPFARANSEQAQCQADPDSYDT
jgi:hypothetical protein